MKKNLAAALGFAMVIATACSTVRHSDSQALQGTWEGHELARSEAICRIVITGNTLEFRGADAQDWCKGTFTLREDTTPRQLVGVLTEVGMPQYAGKTVNAIYRLQDGQLELAGNEPGNPEMPSDFNATGTRRFLLKKL
jgi:uncharacterized protein (TIGR03067 family)